MKQQLSLSLNLYSLTASIDTKGFDRYLNWNLPALHHRKKNSIANTYTHTVSTTPMPRWTSYGNPASVSIAWRKHERRTMPMIRTSTTGRFR